MINNNQENQSPHWASTTKTIVGLSAAAILLALVVTFRNYVAPLLLAFILVYLLYPLANRLHKHLKLPWRLAVTLIYAVFLIILISLLVWGGFVLVEQIQNLIIFLQNTISDLPKLIAQLTSYRFQIGPYTFGMEELDPSFTNQILGSVQPMLSRVGTLVGSLASGTLVTLGWGFFVLLISYFVLAETGGVSSRIINIRMPGYQDDVKRMTKELSHIWNAFLRGQMLVMLVTILIYTGVLGILGVRFYYGLAFLAAFARLIPYVGPLVAWTTYGLVCYFQPGNPFGLLPLFYAGLTIGVSLLTDSIIDNFITTRLLADALKIHPAALMITALIAVSLFGVVGAILAAPVLATILLFSRYTFGKLFDLDPWENIQTLPPPKPFKLIPRIVKFWRKIVKWYTTKFGLPK